jgi:hypothetical protein
LDLIPLFLLQVGMPGQANRRLQIQMLTQLLLSHVVLFLLGWEIPSSAQRLRERWCRSFSISDKLFDDRTELLSQDLSIHQCHDNCLIAGLFFSGQFLSALSARLKQPCLGRPRLAQPRNGELEPRDYRMPRTRSPTERALRPQFQSCSSGWCSLRCTVQAARGLAPQKPNGLLPV